MRVDNQLRYSNEISTSTTTGEEKIKNIKAEIPSYEKYKKNKFDIVEKGTATGFGEKVYRYDFPEVTAGIPLSFSKGELEAIQNLIVNSVANGNCRVIEIPKEPSNNNYFERNSYTDRYEGKTVIENKKPLITISSIYNKDGSLVEPPHEHKSRRLNGEPTHEFFYEKSDFLFEAADNYSKLKENEIYRKRDINDTSFINSSLEFFLGGKYTGKDYERMENELTDIVLELAAQKRNGLTPDLTKVKTELTIGDKKISVSKLFEMQSIGKGLSKAMQVDTVSNSLIITDFAAMGLCKAFSDYYGNKNKEIGRMFSSSMDKLYISGIKKAEKAYNNTDYSIILNKNDSYEINYFSKKAKENLKTGLEITKLFSSLNTSNKTNMKNDFNNKIADLQSIINNYCRANNISAGSSGYLSSIGNISSIFNTLLNNL